MPKCASCRHWYYAWYNHCPICAGTKRANPVLDAIATTAQVLAVAIPLALIAIWVAVIYYIMHVR